MKKNRVVVTGLGIISSIGEGKDEFWKNLISGQNGISDVTLFSTEGFRTNKGGEVKNFKPEKYIPSSRVSLYGRTSQLAIAAAKLALKDANIQNTRSDFFEIVVGTTNGESQVLEVMDKAWVAKGDENVWTVNVLKYPGNMIALNIAKEFNLNSNCTVIPTACAAGNYAIGYGYDKISLNESDIAIVGGADGLSRVAYMGFDRLFAITPDKCRPFDKNRKGINVGEGAGILVLESLESAQKRKAKIYCEVLGYGLSCDASHMTIPNGDGVQAVMIKAMKESNIKKEEVGYISAHGTGTPMNDKVESNAIKAVFGKYKVPVSSIKSMLGHTMGAASAIEAITCVLALIHSEIPPTINHETDDDECPINCVPNKSISKHVGLALNNSYAFGGNNACVVMREFNSYA